MLLFGYAGHPGYLALVNNDYLGLMIDDLGLMIDD
jgi:hypothetical protein